MASSAVEATRYAVRCPGCGGERWLSYRNRKSTARCASCRSPEQGKPTDALRAWWLRNYSDEAIAELAVAAFGFGDPEAVARWRARLLSNGRLRRRRTLAVVSGLRD